MSKKVDPFDLASGVPKLEGDLRPAPKAVDRISRRVLIVLFGVIAVLAGLFLLALDSMDKPKKTTQETKEVKAETVVETKDEILGFGGKTIMSGTLIKPPVVDAKPETDKWLLGEKPVGKGSEAVGGVVPAMGSIPAGDHGAIGGVKPLTPAEQLANQEKLARHNRMAQARSGGLVGKAFGAEDQVVASVAQPSPYGLGAGMQPVNVAGAGGKSDGEQESKLEFLKGLEKEGTMYHPNTPMPALSPNEIKIGSYIPMVLEQSINSDLPGQITARVTEDVYDTITGCRLLVPAMSKAIGRYDSKIAIGQGRMLVAWNSMVFPDGAELNLGAMQGYDSSGQAGLGSDVDNHYFRMFGLTFGMSMIASAVTLSVPQPNPGTSGSSAPPTPAQTVAANLAQQYGTLGAQILGKYMAVQPTLRNAAGERFVVMVPRTIVFRKVWRNRCAAKSGA